MRWLCRGVETAGRRRVSSASPASRSTSLLRDQAWLQPDFRYLDYGIDERHAPMEASARPSAGYDHAMGLFRSRARRNREKAAAQLVNEQATTTNAVPQLTSREVTAETRPNPDQPGWGRAIGQQISKDRGGRASSV
jgi:hypothetical protein